MCNPFARIHLLRGRVRSKDAPALPVDRHRHGAGGRVGEKILQNQPALVRKPEQPAHQFEKPRLLTDIEQLKKLRTGVPFQGREKPFGFVNRTTADRTIEIVNDRSHLFPNASRCSKHAPVKRDCPRHRDFSVIAAAGSAQGREQETGAAAVSAITACGLAAPTRSRASQSRATFHHASGPATAFSAASARRPPASWKSLTRPRTMTGPVPWIPVFVRFPAGVRQEQANLDRPRHYG